MSSTAGNESQGHVIFMVYLLKKTSVVLYIKTTLRFDVSALVKKENSSVTILLKVCAPPK